MPATCNVNMLTVVHAGSGGMAMSFPDVCKTPVPPGATVPIPYPNIAMSADTSDGSSTVKIDGNPVMLKTSNFKTSSGDEPGSIGGVVSGKVKGKAEPINYSFDVKFDGENVFRLTDPMKTNCGSKNNTLCMAESQSPLISNNADKSCKKVVSEAKWQAQKKTEWDQSGIIVKHRSRLQRVSEDMRVVLYFRKTKDECGPWIEAGHMPKPHTCISGTTIMRKHVPSVGKFLEAHFSDHPGALVQEPAQGRSGYSRNPASYVGIVGTSKRSNASMRVPLHGGPLVEDGKIVRVQESGQKYDGKWMTGDYDLFEVLGWEKPCEQISGRSFAELKKAINSELGWDAIQHPPQAQWSPTEEELAPGVKPFDMTVLIGKILRGKAPDTASVIFDPQRLPMKVIDTPLTIVAGEAVVCLESNNDVVEALICKECEK